MTYRRRYQGNLAEPAPVLDLILADDTNPRSLVFQLAALASEVDGTARNALQPRLPHRRAAPRECAPGRELPAPCPT